MANKVQIEIGATNKTRTAIEEADRGLKNLGRTFQMLQNIATVGIVGQGLAATVNVFKGFADQVERLGNIAKTSGTSIQNVQTLERVFQEAGIGAETAGQALGFLSVKLGEANSPLRKLIGETGNAYDALLLLSDAYAASTDQLTKNAIAMMVLGRGGKAASSQMDDLRAALTTMRTEMDKANVTISESEVLIGKRLDAAFEKAQRRVDGFWKAFVIGAVKSADDVSNAWNKLFELTPSTPRRNPMEMFSVHGTSPGGTVAKPPNLKDILSAIAPATAGARTGAAPSFVNYPQYGYGPAPRQVDMGFAPGGFGTFANRAFAATRFLGGAGADSNVEKAMQRNKAALDTFAAYSEGAFQNMFGRIISIQTRSNNLIVNLAADLWNAIAASLAQRAGSAAAGFFVDLVSGFIPGLKKTGGGKTTAQPLELHVHTLESKTISDALLNGSFRDAGVAMARRAAVA